jgi:HEPN domain-containing protein
MMEKDTKKQIKFWLDCVEDNFKASKAMLETDRWSLAMFMCQQTIEALLKAVFVFTKNERPPYIHKLPRILELTETKVPRTIDIKILKIDAHYIKSRYKEDRFNVKIYNRRNALALIKDTKEVLRWFVKNIKLKI